MNVSLPPAPRSLIFGDGARLADFAAPAATRPALWRVAACLGLFTAFLLGAGAAIGLVLVRVSPAANPFGDLASLSSRAGVLAALATFLIWWPALWLAMIAAHRRGLGSIFPPTQRRPVRLFLAGVVAAVVFGAVTALPSLAFVPVARAPMSLGDWAAGLALGVPLLLVQTGAEELVFRGYLLQQMAARFRSPLAWAMLPSLLFGALHYNPLGPGGALAAIIVPTVGGIVLAAITVRTGGIAAAWGLHFGVNALALLVIAPPDHMSGLGLWRWMGDETALARLAWGDLAAILVLGLAAALIFRPSPRGG